MYFVLYFERHSVNTILRYLQIDKLFGGKFTYSIENFHFLWLQITDSLKGRHLVDQRAQKGLERKKHKFYYIYILINLSNVVEKKT